jgi:hypothetical protein
MISASSLASVWARAAPLKAVVVISDAKNSGANVSMRFPKRDAFDFKVSSPFWTSF